MIKRKFNRKGQEEIVGFVIIIALVSVIVLVLLSFMLTKKEVAAVESYEVESFIQSLLQYTTDCETYTEFLSFQKLITYCDKEGVCLDDENSCDKLNFIAKEIIENSWNVNDESAVKGYEFKIFNEEGEMFALNEGNKTANYKGNYQDFVRSGEDYKVSLTIYE